ncbi:MAG: transposase [Muribaculaceae bacterium]|nr:transposase [Muribaculaceae bacterium]
MGRDPKHDYRGRCIYHITISKAPACPVFSKISGTPANPLVSRTHIGEIIERQILNFPSLHPSLQILQYVIMPDHIHFAIFVRDYLPRVLGRYIGMMKVKTGQVIRISYPEIKDIFIPDFHDRYLLPSHDLQTIIRYIQDNPKRLLERRQNPLFFQCLNNLEINGSQWQAYGNLQLLKNPFKGPVVIHRADSEAVLYAKHRRWRHLYENGGVLVSPFISQAEKKVRKECEEAGGKIILISNQPFGIREKPAAHDFDQCSRGSLLILSPLTPLPPGRETFLFLNSIAESIAIPNRQR